MPTSRSSWSAGAKAIAAILATANPLLAANFVWTPPTASDSQWTNPLNWTSTLAGAPSAMDIVHFSQLPQPADSPVARADPDPLQNPPPSPILAVAGIVADGFYAYDNTGAGITDWRIELTRFSLNESTVVATPFTLDLDSGNGVVQIGHFEEPVVFGDPAIAISGGLTITGQSFFENATHSAAGGFRGTLDVRHGRLTLQDINFDDQDALSTIGGLVDSRDDLSYIPQRLPTAELTVDHSHFDAFKTRGLLIGSIGKASASLINGTVISNLAELRVGGNSSLFQQSHELSTLSMTDSAVTVGDGVGGVYVGDAAAPDLIDTYNGTLTMTRSSIAPSVGVELLDVYVGNAGSGKLTANDASSIVARRMFVGSQFFSFGELRVNSSHINLAFPAGAETADQAGRLNAGSGGVGFVLVAGTQSATSTITARSLVMGENSSGYGDVYIDRDSTLALADSAEVGIRGQGRLTITGRFASDDVVNQRNTYATASAIIGTRPAPIDADPNRHYALTVGSMAGSLGFVVVGEGATLDVTDQPANGADDLDEFGVELWRSTNHQIAIGDTGNGSLTVHADGVVRSEHLRVGVGSAGVGTIVLDKAMLNASAANLDHAIPGTVRISRNTTIGVNGTGTLAVRSPYVKRTGLTGPGGVPLEDPFDDYGLLTASLTVGDGLGASGVVRITQGGQIRVDGTLVGERDLIVAREGAGSIEVSDPLVINNSGPATYVSGATLGTLRVVNGEMKVGGADAAAFPLAKGHLTVHANGLIDAKQLVIGGTTSAGDTFITRSGGTALVSEQPTTFAGGTVRVESVLLRGDSTLAIESNPISVSINEPRDGGFHVTGNVDVQGGTVQLGKVDRSDTGSISASQIQLSGGQLTGGGTIDGDLLVDGGFIAIQLNGATRFTGFDSFDVTGSATFTAGSIVVSAGSYVGAIGKQFDLFRFANGSRTTAFDVINPLASQPGTQWVSYLDADSYTLAVAGATGDTNFDGAVNFDDLLTLAQFYGKAGPQSWITGDFNDDQIVSFDDLLLLAQHYGSNLLGESTTASFAADWLQAQSLVPEPCTAMVFTLLPLTMLARRGSRIRSTRQC